MKAVSRTVLWIEQDNTANVGGTHTHAAHRRFMRGSSSLELHWNDEGWFWRVDGPKSHMVTAPKESPGFPPYAWASEMIDKGLV